MKTLKLTALFLFLAIAGIAQTTKEVIADETELITLKASFKIETSNEAIFKLIVSEFKGEGFKYTASIKKDRTGLYYVYSVPFKMVDIDRVKTFFNRINK